jgi:kinesin family protein 5
MAENVQVVVRFRPFNDRERSDNSIEIDTVRDSLSIPDRNNVHEFTFDHVFDGKVTQEEVYEKIARQAVESVCKGYNATIFAYGASGSGKSFCMFGNENGINKQRGIIPRSCETIFKNISKDMIETTVKCSFIEIYKERIIDLLNRVNDDLHIRQYEKGVYIAGLTEKFVYSPEDILRTIADGTLQRTVSSTSVNNVSSRSHALLTITITQIGLDGSEIISKLNLVDLAGSENVGRSEAQGLTLQEAQNINKSLSALGNVINALTETGREHIPYRDSKLTYILQDSLGGNSKTIMIATASPAISVASETLNTMKFAKRAKQIKNAPKVNKNESNLNLLKTIEILNKKIELLEEKLADSQVIDMSANPGVINDAILFKTRSNRWENKLVCLENELSGERERIKRLSELFEKQRKLSRVISKELIKERIRTHGITSELEQYKIAYESIGGKKLNIKHINEDELEAELDSP